MNKLGISASVRISDTLRAAFRMSGDRVAYEDADREYLLRDHARIAAVMTADLATNYAVKPGDRVAVLAQTSQAYIALWHAALLGHFTIVPVNNRLAPPEIKAILENAQASIVVCDLLHAKVAGALADELGIESAALASLKESTVEPVEPRNDVGEDEIPVIIYTGGTTGVPKGVAISQKALGIAGYKLRYVFDAVAPGTCHYAIAPLFHMSGYPAVFGPVLAGNRMLVVPSFDPSQLVEHVPEYRITQLGMTPVMIDSFLDAIEDNPEPYQHLREITYGGAPISSRTLRRLSTLLPEVKLLQSYGMTESVTPLTLLDPLDHQRGGKRLQSTGRVLPGIELEVRDSHGDLAETGQSGEIFVRAHLMMSGYWNNEKETKAAVVNGWYRTGDVGYLDEEGYLYLVDRAKDMIVSGGENIYSVEVERAIARVAQVEQVAVIAIPSETWGEQVHAILVPVPGVEIDTESMLRALRDELAGYKCPKSVEVRTEPMPLTGINKIDKVALRKMYWDGQGKNVN